MNAYAIGLYVGIFIMLLVMIGVPVLARLIREKDFQDQCSGRKPIRRAPRTVTGAVPPIRDYSKMDLSQFDKPKIMGFSNLFDEK